MVFISNGKITCFGLQRPSSDFDNFLAKRVLYNMPTPRGDVEISSSFYVLLLSQIWWDVYWVNEFVGAYKIPHLQSQFLPNSTPTQLERSTPSYLQFIDPIDIPPNSA